MLVGAAELTQRPTEATLSEAGEALDLMVGACRAAELDAGSAGLLARAGAVLVPRGTWAYRDAPRLVARAIGADAAHGVVAEVGVLQTTLIDRAAVAIARGELDVAVIVGGEARRRDAVAAAAGTTLAVTTDDGAVPDEVLAPGQAIVSAAEIGAGLITPVGQYAVMEHARRSHDGQDPVAHAAALAALWADLAAVAAGRPQAWDRRGLTAEDIGRPGPANRPVALPYLRLHNSQWTVDQAAALVLTSLEVARARGIDADRLVFPHAVIESNHIVPLSQRRDLWRAPGFAVAAAEMAELLGVDIDAVAHLDLYSCFPIAVRAQMAEMGIGADRPVTVTGGMTFGGGPLNNYVLGAVAAMAGVVRGDPGSRGMVTAVSGLLTKQALSVWSSSPTPGGYRSAQVGGRVAAVTATVPVVGADPGPPPAAGPIAGRPAVPTDGSGRAGPGRVASYTVLYDRAADADSVAVAAIALVDRPDGSRAIAASRTAEVLEAFATGDWCGRAVRVDGHGELRPVG